MNKVTTMQKIIIFSLALIFTSCGTLRMSDKPEYFQKVSYKTADKAVKITMANGEKVYGEDFSVNKDSAVWINRLKMRYQLNSLDIQSIQYSNGGLENSAKILLKNGESIEAVNVESENGIVNFYQNKESRVSVPRGELYKVSVKNHFYGAVTGFAIGTMAGMATGALFIKIDDGHGRTDKFMSSLTGGVIGALVGIISGAIIGTWDTYYLQYP